MLWNRAYLSYIFCNLHHRIPLGCGVLVWQVAISCRGVQSLMIPHNSGAWTVQASSLKFRPQPRPQCHKESQYQSQLLTTTFSSLCLQRIQWIWGSPLLLWSCWAPKATSVGRPRLWWKDSHQTFFCLLVEGLYGGSGTMCHSLMIEIVDLTLSIFFLSWIVKSVKNCALALPK